MHPVKSKMKTQVQGVETGTQGSSWLCSTDKPWSISVAHSQQTRTLDPEEGPSL